MAIKPDISTPNAWHVLKGETQYGPYTYEEMLQMLQSKTLFGYDFAWATHLDNWYPISDLPEFSVDRISRLAEKANDADVFFKRKHKRINCRVPVYVHNNQRLWTGTVESISQGGALILMNNPLLLPGDQITVHFKKLLETSEPFNSRAEIISKRLTKQKIEHDTLLYYAIKFNLLQTIGEKEIQKFVKEESKLMAG